MEGQLFINPSQEIQYAYQAKFVLTKRTDFLGQFSIKLNQLEIRHKKRKKNIIPWYNKFFEIYLYVSQACHQAVNMMDTAHCAEVGALSKILMTMKTSPNVGVVT